MIALIQTVIAWSETEKVGRMTRYESEKLEKIKLGNATLPRLIFGKRFEKSG